MTHRWEIRVLRPNGEWVQTYSTRMKAHVAYHNRYRLEPSGSEIYMYDLDKQELVKMRSKS